MSKEMTIIVLGIWVAIVPYLGLPGSWRTAILLLSGIGIAFIGFLMRGETLSRSQHRASRATFVEHVAEPATSHTHDQEGTGSLN